MQSHNHRVVATEFTGHYIYRSSNLFIRLFITMVKISLAFSIYIYILYIAPVFHWSAYLLQTEREDVRALEPRPDRGG